MPPVRSYRLLAQRGGLSMNASVTATGIRKPARVSVEDYLDAEESAGIKHEDLGGAVYAMAGGTNDHAAISANALAALGGAPSRQTMPAVQQRRQGAYRTAR